MALRSHYDTDKHPRFCYRRYAIRHSYPGVFWDAYVSVDERYVAIKFGCGIFRKRFTIDEVASVARVKNHWYYGWGIRVWFWPYMWIYNVSGFDAVELVMKNKRVYRIGTDVPEELEAVIKSVL